jgi:hypothetical protein
VGLILYRYEHKTYNYTQKHYVVIPTHETAPQTFLYNEPEAKCGLSDERKR